MYSRVFRAAAEIRLHILEQRLFAQVVANHVRHVDVYALVVGYTGAGGVGQRHVAQLRGVYQTPDAQQRVGPEHQRVEEVVINAAVDHVHLLQAVGGAHIHVAIPHYQVLAFHQFGPDFAGEEHVLIEGGVVDAGREQGDDGVALPAGAQFLKGGLKGSAVALHFLHPRAAVDAGEGDLGRLPVGYHV